MDAEDLDLLSTESSEGFYIAEDVCQKEADTYHGMPPKEENSEEETEGETKGKHCSDLQSANAKERGPRESQSVKANLVAVILPKILNKSSANKIFEEVMSIPKKHLQKSGGADKKGRDCVASYIDRPGEVAGSVLWVPTGRQLATHVEEKMFWPQKPLGLSPSRKSAFYQH
ncbi:hypothetical protein BS47DRAFT_1369810 [Hydnum rufescens UP504]|uniref:Uncharacterized protein n=1 Tax=Hydnum rufescens UP504 TaxID=1448309 RepID=A0A9P6DFX8_9AGAM|nr:hypothetical protein BS47DRAFT_1369810 [Hydnum rufescens UP504]